MQHLSPFASLVWAHWFALLWATNGLWWLSEIWIFARDLRRPGSGAVRSDRLSRLVIVAAIPVAIYAGLYCLHHYPFARWPDGEIGALRFGGGLLLMWVGIAIRVTAVLTLGRLFRTTVTLQADHKLVTSGLYARVRHPSYLGALLTMTGQGLTMGNWLSLIVCVSVLLTALLFRMFVEERALKAHFGAEFDAYAKRVWRLLPGLW